MSARPDLHRASSRRQDSRARWLTFTRRLGAAATVDELAPKLVNAVVETVGATGAIVYLVDPGQGGIQPAAAVGTGYPAPTFADDALVLIASIRARRSPLVLENGSTTAWRGSADARAVAEGSVLLPLRWRDELIGLLAIGGERSGEPYTGDDLELMEALGEHAAAAIVTARLSESRARSREFETFHRLTAFVAHDLKNSITALSMLSENALKNFDDREFQRDALTTVAQTVDRMRALLGRLREAPSATRLRLAPVDLAAVAREAASPVVKSDRIDLVTELMPLSVSADIEALATVIQNLVTNAVQSIDGRGTVMLKTYAEDGRAVVAVSDTGCGMSEDFVRTSLFAPSRSTKQGGWGIGLYHVKGLVEAHGGTIDVSSREGTGSTFFVRLPIGGRT
jgi:putative PEP-CTERM system histidine kinase